MSGQATLPGQTKLKSPWSQGNEEMQRMLPEKPEFLPEAKFPQEIFNKFPNVSCRHDSINELINEMIYPGKLP